MYAEVKHNRPVQKFPQFVGLDLIEAVRQTRGDKIIHIGSVDDSAFFFIGTAVDFENGIKRGVNDYLKTRKIIEAYSKIKPSEGVIFIIEGRERGRYWTKDEADADRAKVIVCKRDERGRRKKRDT